MCKNYIQNNLKVTEAYRKDLSQVDAKILTRMKSSTATSDILEVFQAYFISSGGAFIVSANRKLNEKFYPSIIFATLSL